MLDCQGFGASHEQLFLLRAPGNWSAHPSWSTFSSFPSLGADIRAEHPLPSVCRQPRLEFGTEASVALFTLWRFSPSTAPRRGPRLRQCARPARAMQADHIPALGALTQEPLCGEADRCFPGAMGAVMLGSLPQSLCSRQECWWKNQRVISGF